MISSSSEPHNNASWYLIHFRSGDAVWVKHGGPLQDLEMIFVGSMTGSRRVCVLLSFLGRLKQVHLDGELLKKKSVPDLHSSVERLARKVSRC